MTGGHLASAGRPARADLGIDREAGSRDHAGGREAGLCLALIVCLAAQGLVALLLFRPGGFWSPDSAVRFVQVESLLRARGHDVSVPYPAAALDPSGQHFPIGSWFHFGRAGRFYLSYLPYFPMASALFYRLFGSLGLLLIPVAAGLGAVWITYAVLRRRAPEVAGAAAVALGIATPLLIYSAVFWDHSLAVVLAAGALALAAHELDRDRPVSLSQLALAGGVLGLGLWVRNEMYLLALAVVLAWMYASSSARLKGAFALGGGLAVPAVILWTLNTRIYGSPFGWKGHDLAATRVSETVHAVAGHTPAVWLGEKLGNAYYLLASPDFYAFSPRAVALGLALAIALVVAGALLRIGVGRRSISVVGAGVLVAVAAGGLIVSGRTSVSGLLPAAPVVVLALLAGAASPWERFLWATSALFTAAVIATGTHGGLQWGPRYLLPVLPPLVWLAAAGLDRACREAPRVWPALRAGAATVVAVSLLIQASGVDQVRQATARNAGVNQWLRGITAEIVVTPLEWLTLGAGPVYFEKDLMLVKTPEEFQTLVTRFSEQRVARWAYIPQSGTSFLPFRVAQWTDGRPWRFRPVDDHTYEGLRFVTFAGFPGSSGFPR